MVGEQKENSSLLFRTHLQSFLNVISYSVDGSDMHRGEGERCYPRVKG